MRFTKPILLAVVAIALATYASDRFAMSTPDEAMQCCDTMPCSSHGFYWLSTNKEHNSSAALFIFQLLRSVVHSILNTVATKRSGQLIVLFCTVPEGIFLVRWKRAWSDHAGMAFPVEYEAKKNQEEWKG
jgi:hypothetical protein